MISCPVCLAENDEFAVTCAACKAFLRNRVPNLNLFETGWRILESPRRAFQTIVMAEHKNYVLLLFALFGVALSFTLFWYFRLGRHFETLLDMIPAAAGIGLLLGVVSMMLLTLCCHLVAKLFGGRGTWKNSMSVLAYATVPIVLSLALVLPIELLTFGMYLFTANPHPYALKPVSYVILVAFDALVSMWSVGLAVVGTAVAHRIGYAQSAMVVLLTLAVFGGSILLTARIFGVRA